MGALARDHAEREQRHHGGTGPCWQRGLANGGHSLTEIANQIRRRDDREEPDEALRREPEPDEHHEQDPLDPIGTGATGSDEREQRPARHQQWQSIPEVA